MDEVSSEGNNAAMESYFSLLHKPVLNRRRWDAHVPIRRAIDAWFGWTYHRRQHRDPLGRLTPNKYEPLPREGCRASSVIKSP